MENFMDTITTAILSADLWIIAIAGVLAALAGVAKLTKTKKDDKYVQKAIDGLNKVKAIIAKLKPTTKK